MNADRPSRLDVLAPELHPPGDPPPRMRRSVEPDVSVQQRFEDAMARKQEAEASQPRPDARAPAFLLGFGQLPSPASPLASQAGQADPSDADIASNERAPREQGPHGLARGARHEGPIGENARTRMQDLAAATAVRLASHDGTETRQVTEAPHKAQAPAAADAGPAVSQAFGLVAPGIRVGQAMQASERSALSQRLSTVIAGLYVGEGSHGGKQVRLDLKEEALPGVTVAIEEIGGRMQIDFTCSVEASRLRLNDVVPAVAPDVAVRLERDVLMRVQTDDDEDPCLLEVAASPQPTTG